VWFREAKGFTALLEHMNRNVAAHGIPVEVKVGTRSDPAGWSTRDRIDVEEDRYRADLTP